MDISAIYSLLTPPLADAFFLHVLRLFGLLMLLPLFYPLEMKAYDSRSFVLNELILGA
jgi:hypothetical protein